MADANGKVVGIVKRADTSSTYFAMFTGSRPRRMPSAPNLELGVREEQTMAFSAALAERIAQTLARRKGITERKMFGGIGFLLNGNLLVGVWKQSLVVRLGSQEAEDSLKEPFVRVFDITGRPMKNWVLVEPDGCAQDDQLQAWIQRAVKFVAKLPPK